MLKRKDEFGDIEPCPLLRELRLMLQMPEQLPPTLEVRHKIQIAVRLETELEADEERALERALQDFALPDRVRYFFFRDDLFFREDFHCVDSSSVLFPDLEDAPECAAPDKLEELEIARCESAFVLVTVEYGS